MLDPNAKMNGTITAKNWYVKDIFSGDELPLCVVSDGWNILFLSREAENLGESPNSLTLLFRPPFLLPLLCIFQI